MKRKNPFDYIRNPSAFFQPKTPAAALKGVQEGYLPLEAYIFRAGSVRPLYEPPFDLEELERVLSKKDLDMKTKLLLRKIFQQLSESPDPEVTLFAAESVNLLEGRYLKTLECLKKEPVNPGRHLQEARLYHELAQLNQEVSSLRGFYLQEAQSCLSRLRNDDGDVPLEAFPLEQEVLLGLGALEEAEDRALAVLFNRSTDPEVLLALCRISFFRKDFVRLALWARALRETSFELPPEARTFLESWEAVHG